MLALQINVSLVTVTLIDEDGIERITRTSLVIPLDIQIGALVH